MSDTQPIPGRNLHVAARLVPGDTFWDKYRILSIAGRGAASIVYQAENLQTGQIVAVKVLDDHRMREKELIQRFVREAQTTQRLNHPNTVKVYEWGVDDDECPFMVIEYVDGKSLADLIKEQGDLDYKRAINIMGQICDVVSTAHALGIVHRDLKPENIMLFGQDQVKVVDFGIARLQEAETADGAVQQAQLTRAGAMLGTPLYMSPEQLRGGRADHLSDIYSLGVVLYEMLTGKPPFASKNTAEIVVGHLNRVPEAPVNQPTLHQQIPANLNLVVLKALAKDPDRRYGSVAEFCNSLLDCTGFDVKLVCQAKDGQSKSGSLITRLIKRKSFVAALILLSAAILLIIFLTR